VQRGLVARASDVTMSEGPPTATAKRRGPFGRLLRRSSVTMRQHGSLLTSCTRPKSAPSRWVNV